MRHLGLIEDRLTSSINMDVVNGNSFERSVFEKQVKEAIEVIIVFRSELKNIVNADLKNFQGTDEFVLWSKNRASFILDKY